MIGGGIGRLRNHKSKEDIPFFYVHDDDIWVGDIVEDLMNLVMKKYINIIYLIQKRENVSIVDYHIQWRVSLFIIISWVKKS